MATCKWAKIPSMRSRIACLLFSVLLLIALTGCDKTVRSGGSPNPKPSKRIVSLSPGSTEIVALTTYDRLVGRTSSCNYPQGSLSDIPIVGDVKPNYEKLAEADPELVIYDPSLYNESDLKQIQTAVPKAELYPISIGTLAEYNDWMIRYGSRVRAESSASEYADKVYLAMQKARAVAPATPPKVLVLSGYGPGSLYAAGNSSFVADVVKVCGGDLLAPESKKFELVSPEYIVTSAPDLVLVAGMADDFMDDPRFKTLPAVKNRQVYGIPGDILLRTGFRVDKLIDAVSKTIQSASLTSAPK